MKKIIAVTLILLFTSIARAEGWKLGQFISVKPPADLDLTFQVMEAYDPNEEILVGWIGEELDFLMVVDEQPGGLDNKAYWRGLENEYKKITDDGKLNVLKEGQYETDLGVPVSYKVFLWVSDGERNLQIIHLVKNQQIAYWVMLSPQSIERADLNLESSIKVLKTAQLFK